MFSSVLGDDLLGGEGFVDMRNMLRERSLGRIIWTNAIRYILGNIIERHGERGYHFLRVWWNLCGWSKTKKSRGVDDCGG